MNVMTRRELVESVLRQMFQEHPGGIYKDDAVRIAAEAGITPRSLGRVAAELGVTKISQGPLHQSVWRPPASWLEEES